MARQVRVLETEIQGILSASDTSARNNPMTQPIPTTLLKKVRVSAWLGALNDLKVRPFVAFSDDGVTWDTPKELQTTYWTAAGWSFPTDPVGLYGLGVTPRRFCRFGLQALNTVASTTTAELAQARLRIDIEPVVGGSLEVFCALVNSGGSTTTDVFIPLTGHMTTTEANEVRRTLDLAAVSGNILVALAYQLTNTPDDPTSWGTAVTVGTSVSGGIEHGTTFTSLGSTFPDSTYVRWGVNVRNGSGTLNEVALLRMILDWRQ